MEATQKRLDLGKYKSSGHVTYYLGDTHEGAANHCNEKLKKAIELIEKDGDAWIGLGDYVDCINHRDPRFNPQEISERYCIKDLEDLPRRQSDHFLSAIAPIKDRCLGLIYGNHEDSIDTTIHSTWLDTWLRIWIPRTYATKRGFLLCLKEGTSLFP